MVLQYSKTGVPEQSCQLTTINGCDSVAVLNLTINNSDNTSSSVTACDEFTWSFWLNL